VSTISFPSTEPNFNPLAEQRQAQININKWVKPIILFISFVFIKIELFQDSGHRNAFYISTCPTFSGEFLISLSALSVYHMQKQMAFFRYFTFYFEGGKQKGFL
jgi:hypothetical protein